jgi:outer membrane lipoprotein-sorting protein
MRLQTPGRFARTLLLVLAGAVPVAAQADAATAASVLACMRANVPATVRVEDIELTSTDAAGNARILKGRLVIGSDNGLLRAQLRMQAPPDLAGAGYLLREGEAGTDDQMWIYLPAVRRVRRISSAGADGPLLGTDFSYGDIKSIANAFSGGEVTLAPATETLDGRAMWRLDMSPKAAAMSRYSHIRVWVDQASCVALKVEFDVGNQPAKELRAPADALKRFNHYWYVSQVEARDLEQGTRTRLQIQGLTAGTPVPSGTFDPHAFLSDN